jgi:Tfp pilus assembly protein PilX
MRHRRALHAKREAGSVLVIALLLMVLLSLLGITLLTVAATEHSVAFNSLWSEGALMATEAGVNRGLNQLTANPDVSITRFPDCDAPCAPTTLAFGYTYRSGGRADAGPQPLVYVGSQSESGYSIAVGTGYNPGGYAFHTYQLNATGTGPRNATREAQVRARYGPVAQ